VKPHVAERSKKEHSWNTYIRQSARTMHEVQKKGDCHFNSFSRILAVEVEKRIDKVKMAIEFIEPPVLISISPGGV